MRYITAQQYAKLKNIPRGRMTARFLVYVGAIIIKEDKVLVCRAKKSKYPGWQYPGGKVLWSENITDALKREVLEETGLIIEPDKIVGLFQRETGPEDEEFIRVLFTATVKKQNSNKGEDPEIKAHKFVKIADILSGKVEMQSKQMVKELKRVVDQKVYPLDVMDMYKW